MNPFNKKLNQAKRRQKKIYLISGITVLTSLLILAVLIVISRGTRIEINPGDAKAHAVYKVVQGLGFSLGDTVYSLTGNLVIAAAAPGFKAATADIDPAAKVFPLKLFPLPGRLVCEISGDKNTVSKTAWRINGRDMALSEKLDIELEAGSHTVIADNLFFQQKKMEVAITRGKTTLLQVSLLPVEGVLSITSKPSGAAVFLDNRKAGVTPLQLDQNGGHYRLHLVLENHIEVNEQLSITRTNPEVSRNYQLQLRKGRVKLDLKPKGGTLLVNGIKMPEPLFLEATLEHRLTYMKPGFYPGTQTVIPAAGQEKKVSIQLKAESGQVEISSHPPAAVWIDGKKMGVSPVSIHLSAVAHKITFKKSGYRSVFKIVKPRGGTIQKVSASLLTEYQARLREAPREVTNTAGVKLKLYMIQDGLTMGAPRWEKGQRANEFQKKIHLTKPFYAGLFEITNRQFAKFNSKKAAGPSNTPVTSVSWQEAAAFCNWLSAKESLVPFYKTAKGKVTGFDRHTDGYRLLSEGEWEWLARKSGKKKQTLFTWGNDRVIPPKTANVADESARGQVRFFVPNYTDGYAGIAPVGSFTREPSGLYDMAGNTSEWVHDFYSILQPKEDTMVRNPLGEQRGHSHVVKGANWRSGTITTLRPAFREGLTEGRDDLGFRIGRYLYGGKNE